MSTELKIIGPAPSLHNAPIETEDYQIMLAEVASGATGYVLMNKHTNVLEYVARQYPEAVELLNRFQDTMNELSTRYRPRPQLVQ